MNPRANVAARYRERAAGLPDDQRDRMLAMADRVEAGEDGFWAVRHEEIRLEREAGNG